MEYMHKTGSQLDAVKIVVQSKLNYACIWASQIAQLVKNSSTMQVTLVRFLGWEDRLEKGQATHSSTLELPLWLSW